MATPSLSALLEQSRQLNNKFQSPDLPALQLGLDQIEAQSRKAAVRARAAPTSGLGAYGHDGETGGIAADDEQIARALVSHYSKCRLDLTRVTAGNTC